MLTRKEKILIWFLNMAILYAGFLSMVIFQKTVTKHYTDALFILGVYIFWAGTLIWALYKRHSLGDYAIPVSPKVDGLGFTATKDEGDSR